MSRAKTTEEYSQELVDKGLNFRCVGEYKNAKTKIKHICLLCNSYVDIIPSNVLARQGCSNCSRLKSTEAYNNDLASRGIKFVCIDKYKGIHTKVLHKCNICGNKELISPHRLLYRKICTTCTHYYSKKKTTREYDDELFNKELNFACVEEYKGSHTTIKHVCLTCFQEVLKAPARVLEGSGCPNCNTKGFNPSLPSAVYIIRLPELWNLYKIGISNNYKRRFKEFNSTVEELKIFEFSKGSEARSLETYLHKKYANFKENTMELRSGNTETFYDLPIDKVIEDAKNFYKGGSHIGFNKLTYERFNN